MHLNDLIRVIARGSLILFLLGVGCGSDDWELSESNASDPRLDALRARLDIVVGEPDLPGCSGPEEVRSERGRTVLI